MKKIKRILALSLINNFFKGTRFWSIKRKLLRMAGISVGSNTKVVGPLSIGTVADLCIGNNTWIGANLKIYGNGKVHIAENCDLAPDISFITGSHIIGTEERRAGQGISYSINIKKGCWIGARVTVMGDVSIESGAIVGACSFVNKDVKKNNLVVGIPAEFKRKL